jgi:hypothetical protein
MISGFWPRRVSSAPNFAHVVRPMSGLPRLSASPLTTRMWRAGGPHHQAGLRGRASVDANVGDQPSLRSGSGIGITTATAASHRFRVWREGGRGGFVRDTHWRHVEVSTWISSHGLRALGISMAVWEVMSLNIGQVVQGSCVVRLLGKVFASRMNILSHGNLGEGKRGSCAMDGCMCISEERDFDMHGQKQEEMPLHPHPAQKTPSRG